MYAYISRKRSNKLIYRYVNTIKRGGGGLAVNYNCVKLNKSTILRFYVSYSYLGNSFRYLRLNRATFVKHTSIFNKYNQDIKRVV